MKQNPMNCCPETGPGIATLIDLPPAHARGHHPVYNPKNFVATHLLPAHPAYLHLSTR
jgi:hypothetical protein